MVNVGEIIELDDSKEYIVVSKKELHNIVYVYLITNSKPLEILIATEKDINSEIILEEVKDNDELDYVLSQFALEMEQN